MPETNDYVLAVLSVGEGTRKYTPVQLQKIFFILDQEIPEKINGPVFDFKPYDYGPFDASVYGALDELIELDHIHRDGGSGQKSRIYSVTPIGIDRGKNVLEKYDNKTKEYMGKVVDFATGLSFSQLVQAIYKRYPDMKVNSVFSSK